MEKLGRYVVRNRRKIIIFSALLTFILGFFMTKLEINTRLMDLLPENDPTVSAYKDAESNFKSLDSIIVGVEGREQNIKDFIDATAPVLSEKSGVKEVVYHTNRDFLKKNGFLLMNYKDLENLSRVLTASSLKEFLAGVNDSFETSYLESTEGNKIEKDEIDLLNSLNALETIINGIKTGNVSTQNMENFFVGENYFMSTDKTMGIYTIDTTFGMEDPKKVVKFINDTEKYLNEQAKNYSVNVSMSGSQVLLRDETVVSQRDMEYSSFLSITLIFFIFMLSFKGMRYSFLAVIPLVTGIIWTLGLTYLIIGSLNIMTAMMGAILIGLGIDYSIHIISVYKEERLEGQDIEAAIVNVFKKTMSGVVAAAMTTAIGFLMFAFTDFPGFREFGIVLGMGIISVVLGSIFVLPPMLSIFSKKSYLNESIKRKKSKLEKLEKLLVRKKHLTFLAVIAAVFLVGSRIPDVKFEKDMMKIEAKGLKSVALNRKLIDKFNFSSDNSIIVSNTIQDSQKLYKKADKLKTMGIIESLGYYIPPDVEQLKKLEYLKNIKNKISWVLDSDLYLNELSDEIYRLEDNLVELADLAYIGGEEKLMKKCDSLVENLDLSGFAENIGDYSKNIGKGQKILIAGLKNFIAGVNSEDKIDLDSLPDNLKRRFVGENSKYINIFFPKDDLWYSEFQDAHIKEIDTLSPYVTGSAKIFLRVMDVVKKEGKKVLLLSFIAIYLILIIDLKSFKYATLSILPMLMTVVSMLGIMGWTGFKLDVVNIIAVPLIVGIGIDDGVHIIHRYRIENNIFKTIRSTGKAITLTTLTTMVAFGTLMLSKYMGFVHFSTLITMGVGLAYIMTLFLLFSTLAIVDKIGAKGKLEDKDKKEQ